MERCANHNYQGHKLLASINRPPLNSITRRCHFYRNISSSSSSCGLRILRQPAAADNGFGIGLMKMIWSLADRWRVSSGPLMPPLPLLRSTKCRVLDLQCGRSQKRGPQQFVEYLTIRVFYNSTNCHSDEPSAVWTFSIQPCPPCPRQITFDSFGSGILGVFITRASLPGKVEPIKR